MGRQRSNASVVMGKWEYRGQWSPAVAGRREVAPANRPFEVLPRIVKVISKDGRGNRPSSNQTNPARQKFVPPQGPKYPPLLECPHLAAFLTAKDRKHLDNVASGMLDRPHEFGFEVKIEPGARTDIRTIYGEQHVTYTSWSILVERRFQAKNGKPQLSTNEVEAGSSDEKILATALYLSDKLSAPRKGLHLFKPFRPPSYVEAWLAQKLNANPKMAERAKSVGGSIYLFADKPIDFAGTRPVSLFVGDEEMPLKNWRDLMVKTCDVLDRKNRKLLQQLALRVGDKFLSDRPDEMRTPRQHELSGLYMEMYLPPYSLVLHSQLLFKKFEYDMDGIGLVYVDGDSEYARSLKNERHARSEQVSGDLSGIDPRELAQIKSVFVQFFPNGIRTSSVIDQNKFRRYYEQIAGVPLGESFEFGRVLPIVGIVQDDKVFPLPETDDSALKVVQEIVATGQDLLYYDEVYAKHSERLDRVGVHSGALLRAMLQKTAPGAYCYGKDCLSTDSELTLPGLIEKHFTSEQVQATYEEAAAWLSYVPVSKIRDWVGWDKRFQRMGDHFALTDRLLLDDEECMKMVRVVEDRVARDGYASKWCVELPRSVQMNADCSENIVNELFFDRYLAQAYDKNGLIITRKGVALDIVKVCLKFCEGKQRVGKDELVAFAHELGAGRAVALGTASSIMVRANDEEFVARDQIAFDVDGIDKVLGSIIGEGFMPLSQFSGYVLLPGIPGFTWNAYLLGSFCRRFSRKFKLMDGQVDGYERDGIVGAIVSQSSGITDYVQLMVGAVRRANVELTSEAVGDYLFENKYVLRRRGMVEEVMDALMKN